MALGQVMVNSGAEDNPPIITNMPEAAVVGYPHDIKGEGIYAYVTLVQWAG